ncbi:Lrp/AsnC family transcriptional regulator [Candidatus Woesearchaeota archaeon]|nr:Lrp/AsnC family transcriptional regulator [Candidatus Woesearchaeota archaeon]
MKLDDKDHDILQKLKNNSRQPIRDIAKSLRLRPSTVHDRIQRLIRDGVIERFTLKLNNAAVGENFIVFMLVAGKPTEYLRKGSIEQQHIKEAFGITGEYDLLLKLKFKDVADFNDYIIRFRKENKDVIKTLTMVATVVLKEEV